MNISNTSAPLPAAADAVAVNSAVDAAAPVPGLPADPALAAAQPGVPLPQAFLQFMQLGGAESQAAALPDVAGAAVPAPDEATQESEEAGGEALGAMAMPLMPSMMAMPAALPAAMRAAAGLQERQERASEAALAPAANSAAVPASAPQAVALLPAGDAGAQLARAGAGAAVQAAQPPAVTAGPNDYAAAAAAVSASQAAPAVSAAGAGKPDAGSQDGAGADAGSRDTSSPQAASSIAPAAPTALVRDGGTLALSGPPTAWRQSLQEALGERMQLQLTKNAEQAVIRLDPPMLGRVEISIRHIAGSLEVNITATHSEVLRQLNTVSDNLRSDLAGRQYTDVSVTVSQAAPRAQATAQGGANSGADAQGRGRQQGQEQDERAPGAALAEAHQSNTAFSLNGRA